MRFVFIFLSLISTLSFSGNGPYVVGVSPASKGMGGTGVANATNGIDASFKNPAMLSELPLLKSGITVDVAATGAKQNANAESTFQGEKSSKAGLALMPALSVVFKSCEKMALGLSAFTYGGAKADHTGEATLQETKVDASFTYIGPTVSYKFFDMWSVGLSPHLVYTELALNNKNAALGTPQTTRPASSTIGYGLKLGTAVTPTKELTLGLSFSPKVRVRYKEVADLDALNLLPAAAGGTSGRGDGKLDDIDAQEPAQVALGVGYAITPAIKVTLDGRYIGWSSADVFKELGWRDQYVLALGGQYRMDKLALRAGFNYTRSVVDTATGENGFANVTVSGHTVSQQSLSNLNLVGFPGISTTNICVGAGYDFTQKITGDFSFVYAPETTVSRSGTGVNPTTGTAGAYSYTAKVSQWSVGLGGTYRF